MQNKGAIRLFAIILGLVCIYQISFTFITRSVENDAREFAAGDTAKERTYLDSIKNEKVFNLGIYNYTYQECKARELVLGLDLQGGMNITLEVSTVDIVRSMANNSTDSSFVKAINLAQANQANSDQDFVTLFGKAWDQVAPGKRLASPSIFGNAQNKEKIDPYKSTNEDVLKVLTTEADAAIDRTFQVLRTRIDKFGVTSPNIQKLGNSGRILVELPGVKDKARVRKLLQGSANLEFWETYQNGEMGQYMQKANVPSLILL
jgi:SecD/SecF fusion protein